jgi:mono/diheme cytochrome c family protein
MLIVCQYPVLNLHTEISSSIKTRLNCMMHYKKFILRFVTALIIIGFTSNNTAIAQAGEALFKANCANCHKVDGDYTGPWLKGVRERQPDKEYIYKWMANPAGMIASDPYAKTLFEKWKPTIMTAYPNLKKTEIDAIIDYVDAYVAPPPTTEKSTKTDDNSLLFGILTLILAVVAFILLQVNSNLRKLSDDKEGVLRGEPVPFYRNKSYLMLGVLSLTGFGFYQVMNAGMDSGRMKNYQPEQPIYYSHKVHAGTNQISCLYCHGGIQDSKSGSIPSVNVCMNCHMAIKEYKGDPIVKEDGSSVNGTAEIQKLYAYAGWNPETKNYNPDNNNDGIPDGAKPIDWVKIHNLPDHVYFNHSQHVKVGKQNCQTCHGNIQEMPEVYQYSDLSMGWCINCHRETKVDFYNKEDSSGNKFYSIYEKFHADLKSHKMDSVTVESIGGTECQKCHY